MDGDELWPADLRPDLLAYFREAFGFLDRFDAYLTVEEKRAVRYWATYEPEEVLIVLASVIVEQDYDIPESTFEEFWELADGLTPSTHPDVEPALNALRQNFVEDPLTNHDSGGERPGWLDALTQ